MALYFLRWTLQKHSIQFPINHGLKVILQLGKSLGGGIATQEKKACPIALVFVLVLSTQYYRAKCQERNIDKRMSLRDIMRHYAEVNSHVGIT